MINLLFINFLVERIYTWYNILSRIWIREELGIKDYGTESSFTQIIHISIFVKINKNELHIASNLLIKNKSQEIVQHSGLTLHVNILVYFPAQHGKHFIGIGQE